MHRSKQNLTQIVGITNACKDPTFQAMLYESGYESPDILRLMLFGYLTHEMEMSISEVQDKWVEIISNPTKYPKEHAILCPKVVTTGMERKAEYCTKEQFMKLCEFQRQPRI